MSDPGAAAESGAELAHRLRLRWTLAEVAATVVGAFVVFGFLHAFHSAEDPHHPAAAALTGSLRLAAFLALTLPIARVWRERRSRMLWGWLAEERAPEPWERDLVLREPLREIAVPAAIWLLAAVVADVLYGAGSLHELVHVTLTIALGGVTTCALIYLLVERTLRPLTARALALQPAERPIGPRVPTRLITAWALASGVPLLGVAMLGVRGLGGDFAKPSSLAAAVLILASAGLVAGSVAIVLSARSVADPIASVRRALARLHSGDLDVQVVVEDGSEVGLLQAGFNEMAAGLRERERLREAFGRHVGEEVARRALADGVALGGEVRDVAALFVDVVGSTALAARRPPTEVVSLLNRFFAVVVDVIEEHGGWVNRFEGDGALCVFGAPTEQPDAATRALAAGRTLRRRTACEIPELELGIGISAGPAVAGNVGAERRLEYTVIGDPINEAARLCELAKRRSEPVLASGASLTRASAAEAAHWEADGEVVLRGRSAPTRLMRPAADPSDTPAAAAVGAAER